MQECNGRILGRILRIMRIHIAAGLALTASLTFAPQARAEVHLTIRDGRVTLNAAGATVHEILVEWAKIGQTKIVNVERIPGGPLTLQFTGVPEAEALDIPVKVIWGEFDPYFPKDMAKDRASHFRNATLHLLRAGHWLQSDVPEQVAKVMLS